MNTNTALVPIRADENVQALFSLLGKHNLQEEKKDTEQLLAYIEKMEAEFSQVHAELQDVKKQLESLQNRGVKATALRVVNTVEEKAAQAKAQLMEVRETFVQGAKLAVRAAKDKGVTGLKMAVSKMHLRSGLSRLKSGLNQCAQHTKGGIDRLAALADELHEMGGHLKNAGRALTGKEPAEISARNADRGVIHGLQAGLEKIGGLFSSMEQRTGAALEKIGRLEEKAAKASDRPSIREELRSMKQARASAPQGRKEKTVEPTK